MEQEHYEIWVTLEKWDGDSKLEDIETCKIGNVDDADGARQLFSLSQDVAMAARPHIDLTVKVYDD